MIKPILSHPRGVAGAVVAAVLCLTPQATLGFSPLAAVTTPTQNPFALFAANNPRPSNFPASPHVSTTIVDAEIVTKHKSTPINPTPVVLSALQNALPKKTSPTSALLGAMLFLGTAFAATNPALAAMSGGRAGGGGYGRSMPSMSRPMPSRSSYGGGYSRGYASPYYGGSTFRPNVFIAPSPIVPFYGGGAGVLPMVVRRGPSFFDLAFFGAITFMVVNTIRGAGQSAMESGGWSTGDAALASPLGKGTTVAQISVALQVPNRDDPQSILAVLERIASNANTDKRAGLQNLTSQVALELLRRKATIVSANTSYDHYKDGTRAQQAFGQVAIRERSKFEQETFNRFRGSDWSNRRSRDDDAVVVSDKATVAVVTLLIEIDGDTTKLPRVSSLANVQEALQMIAADARVGECLQSAEILWTPQDRAESLSMRDVVADYPQLRSV